jgi:hypothetical protein
MIGNSSFDADPKHLDLKVDNCLLHHLGSQYFRHWAK